MATNCSFGPAADEVRKLASPGERASTTQTILSIVARPAVVLLCVCLAAAPAFAAVRYVNLANPSPAPPYTTWATAATNIQDAIDVADAGDEVVVTNGVYATGEKTVDGFVSNRVAVTKPLMLRSVNGPEVTVIDGGGAMRCVYLDDTGIALSGFTLTNGNADKGGGVWSASENVTVTNCVIVANRAFFGGGASGGTLNNCMLTGNSAMYSGGGAAQSTLNNCILIGNSVPRPSCEPFCMTGGGGAQYCTLNNCTLTGNSAWLGGGARSCTLNNCTLTGNSATSEGGGADSGTLNNCALSGNAATHGGGAVRATLNNCTLVGNSAAGNGGGVNNCALFHSIVYYNTAPNDANHSGATLNYSCTTPDSGGDGNITSEPQLAGLFHLSAESPCRGAGSADYATGVDIDGEIWGTPPSIGCDEYVPGAVIGLMSVSIQASYTNVATGFGVNFTGEIKGRVSGSRWEFADGTVMSNRPYASHSWTISGDYAVILTAYNETYPNGISATVIVHVLEQPVQYVALGGTNPMSPYLSWATAATNIQDAVDAAYVTGTILVSNGVYQTGGRVVDGATTNRVAVTKPLTLRSVNGPEVTIIDGGGTTRCVYLDDAGIALSGFTLTNGNADKGGGVWCGSVSPVVSNCVLTGNSARYRANAAESEGGGAYNGTLINCKLRGNSAFRGGGASQSALNNCTLTANSASEVGGGAVFGTLNNCSVSGNSAYQGGGAAHTRLNNCTLTSNSSTGYGGGASSATLNNCTVTGNSANDGGGTHYCALNNCIVYFNDAQGNGANYSDSALNYSCTTPLPPDGGGNITSAPLFVNRAGGNLRLQSNSPCINSGFNSYATDGTDPDGNPRIVGGTVDVGAFEFQAPQSLISYAWLQQFGLPIDASSDTADLDGDRFNNWQEWRAGTDPTNALSALRLLTPRVSDLGLVSWESVPGRTYSLERSETLGEFQTFVLVATGIPAAPGGKLTTYFDFGADIFAASWFYRVLVE